MYGIIYGWVPITDGEFYYLVSPDWGDCCNNDYWDDNVGLQVERGDDERGNAEDEVGQDKEENGWARWRVVEQGGKEGTFDYNTLVKFGDDGQTGRTASLCRSILNLKKLD